MMVNAFVPVAGVPCESVALTVKFEVPAVVGVPDKTPPADRVTPAGSVPAEML